MERIPQVGDCVVYHDPTGAPHAALITNVWTPTMLNLVFVSDDSQRQDSYGRQIERPTSVPHGSIAVHGFYWRFRSEPPNAYNPPLYS